MTGQEIFAYGIAVAFVVGLVVMALRAKKKRDSRPPSDGSGGGGSGGGDRPPIRNK